MRSMNNPHDALFRALLENPARAGTLLREQLPAAIANRLSDSPPRLLDGTFIDAALRHSQSDRLFEVTLRDGYPALLYVLLEHKSAPDPGTPLQLLGYMVQIWRRYAGKEAGKLRALPPIIPLVVYHGAARWDVATSVLDCIAADADILAGQREFRYHLRDLGPVPYEQRSADRAVRAVLGALCGVFERQVGAPMLERILRDLPDGDLLEQQVLLYIVRHYKTTEAAFRQALSNAKPGREEALQMTVAQEWIERGRIEGIRLGEARGESRGEARALAGSVVDILETRFGAVDVQVRERLAGMDAQGLRPLIRRALTAPSVDALFEP